VWSVQFRREWVPGMAVATDGRRVRGDETRKRIVRRASEVATIDGLGAVSLAQLADGLGISKSGVHQLFGTKEELQLETVADARQRFIDVVIAPVWSKAEGLPRLTALVKSWVDYVRHHEFPGGCFITRCSIEFATHPGRVRESLLAAMREWVSLLEGELASAKRQGKLTKSTNCRQLAFEIEALLVAGNNGLLIGDEEALVRTERGVARLLKAARA
jgi:AcrR family transcriptional regulator